jgi:hypothetical protein
MRPLLRIFVAGLASLSMGIAAEKAVSDDGRTFANAIRPFLDMHCVRCHGPEQANSGFRVDQLSADFHAAKGADRWKEVMDKINLGEMPPDGEAQPAAGEFEPVVRWINGKLREVELAARNAGGRIPMRRLNRVEFANTVRDLLHMDPKMLAPLVEALPGDGKAEGFDRLGAALFFDQTQIERTLAVAERIAARAIVDDRPPPHVQRYEFEENPRFQFEEKAKSPFGGTRIDAGPAGFEITGGGVRVIHCYGNHPGDAWGRLGGTTCEDVITEDGYYRIRIRAGGSPGSRGDPIKVRAIYAGSTPVEHLTEIPIEAPLDAPKVHEAVVFLRRGPEGLRRGVNFHFNDIPDLIITTPENNQLNREVRNARNALREAKTNGGAPADIQAAEKAYEEVQARAAKWQGPVRYFNPQRDHENPPTIFVDWAEISGPVLPEWPPKSHTSLLFAGEERRDADYVREIFRRFMPRAYRRPVAEAEVDRVVQLVQQAEREGAGFRDAVRLGLARVLCSPGFLFIQEPAAEEQPRKLNDYELASRLSYFSGPACRTRNCSTWPRPDRLTNRRC